MTTTTLSRTAFRSFWILASILVYPLLADEETPKPPAGQEGKPAGETGGKDITGPAEPPSFEKLLELNGPELFGGKVKMNGDQIEVVFDQDGQMKAGFEGPGIHDSTSDKLKGTNRSFIVVEVKDGKEKLVPGFAVLGLERGAWVSKFAITGNVWIEFGFRIPNLINQQSSFKVRLNWEKGAGYETDFFRKIAYVSGGMERSSVSTPLADYKRHPSAWMPRKGASNRVAFGMRDGKCLLRFNDKELVAFPNAPDKGGKVAFEFGKILFTLDNLKISGKYDRSWCEKRLEELKKAGKLKVKEEAPQEPQPPPPEPPKSN
ncbi:MAG: hypothetical protein HY717_24270 [Planctomycetes bacterium]|nr:hypothetical protein [Planctomycetota bacterium]